MSDTIQITIDEEERIIKRKITVTIETNYIQVYRNLYANHLARVSDGAQCFFLWLQTKTDKEATLPNTGILRKDYEAERGNCGRLFSRYLQELTNAGVLVNLHRGSYRFNPLVVWVGSSEDRKTVAQRLIEGGALTINKGGEREL